MSNRRFKFLVLMLALSALGSILLAACIRPGTPGAKVGNGSTPGSGGGGGGEPTVHMGASNFNQATVTVPKGSKLMLVDDVPVLHTLANGMWDASGNQKLAKEPGAPIVNDVNVNSGSTEIGPFTQAGTFHILCIIHPGMNLTVTVH